MENREKHISNLLKQKFEDFAPHPPEHVWEGIAAALDKGVAPVWYKTLIGKIAIVILTFVLLLGAYWFFNGTLSVNEPFNIVADTSTIGAMEPSTNEKQYNNTTISQESIKTELSQPVNNNSNSSISKPSITKPSQVYQSEKNNTGNGGSVIVENRLSKKANSLSFAEQTVTEGTSMGGSIIIIMESKSIDLNIPLPAVAFVDSYNIESHDDVVPNKKQSGKWALGLFFAPEFIADPFDSLTIQNSYAIHAEPAYYFNSHWFIRSGLGLQYSRDKGFVKANYLNWDYLGSYDDVTEVTFDTTGGIISPVYHTQTKEVYDSILHITISEETNRYLYLQTSLVFGYHNHSNKLGWSIYAGPAVNFVLYSKRDNPVEDKTSVILLKYNLVKRESPQYSFKVGFGLDYSVGKRWLVTVEPEYHYLINGINGGGIYSNPLSGVGIRFGFIYTLK